MTNNTQGAIQTRAAMLGKTDWKGSGGRNIDNSIDADTILDDNLILLNGQ